GIPTDEFTPLMIEGGSFSVSDKPLDEAVPASCGDGPPPAGTDLLRERARTLYENALGETCLLMRELSAEELVPESYELSFRYAYEGTDEPERQARLFRFPCNRGAYNESHVYIYANDYNELRTLS